MSSVGNLASAPDQHRDEWMPIPEAQKVLGETRYMIMSRGLRGEVVIRTIGGRPLVLRESVERILASRESAVTA